MDNISVSVSFSENNKQRVFCGRAEYSKAPVVDSVSLSEPSAESLLKASLAADQVYPAGSAQEAGAGRPVGSNKNSEDAAGEDCEAAGTSEKSAFNEGQSAYENINSAAVNNFKALNGQIAEKADCVSGLNSMLEAGRGRAADADREIADILNSEPAKGKEDNIEERRRERALKLAALEEEYQNKLREQERLEEQESRLVEELAEARSGGSGNKSRGLIDELNAVKPQLDAVKGEIAALTDGISGCRSEMESLEAVLVQKREEADSEKQSKLTQAFSKQEEANRQTETAELEQREAAAEVKDLQNKKTAESRNVSMLQSAFKQAQSGRQRAAAVLNLSKIENLRKKAELAGNLLKSEAADANVVSAQAALAAAEAAAFINPSLIAAAKIHLQTAESIAEAAHLQVGRSEAETAASENKLKASDLALKAAEIGVKTLDGRLKSAQSGLKLSDLLLRQGLNRQRAAQEGLDQKKQQKERLDNFVRSLTADSELNMPPAAAASPPAQSE